MRSFAVVLASLALACNSPGFFAIPGTTTRIEQPTAERDKDYELLIFSSVADCESARIATDEFNLCLPHVDRASGEVRIGYQFLAGEQHVPLPAHDEQLQVQFQGTEVANGRDGQEVKIIPHDPAVGSGTLYILVIDGSGSMDTVDPGSNDTRMKQVRKALLSDEVADAFFPDGQAENAVMLLQFTQGDPVPVGGALQAHTSKRAYKDAVRQLQVIRGYTFLFDAIKYATSDLLESAEVKDARGGDRRAITVVVLTDGFNNERATDTCKDNAGRLRNLLEHLNKVRQGDVRKRPQVHTVGLGRPIRPGFKVPRSYEVPTPADICGKRNIDVRIDGDLELRGIDNASLQLIARAGGGESHIKRGQKKLAEAFRAAAAPKYNWFELRYRMNPFFLRRSFKTKLSLVGVGTAEASIQIHPSAWLDAPPGRLMADGWHEEDTFLRTFLVLMPILGLFVALSYVGAALHNTKRIFFARVRPVRPAARSSAPPPSDGPAA